jgi:hypothetical protein
MKVGRHLVEPRAFSVIHGLRLQLVPQVLRCDGCTRDVLSLRQTFRPCIPRAPTGSSHAGHHNCREELRHGILWSCSAGSSPSSYLPYSLVPAPPFRTSTACSITGPGSRTNTAPTSSRPEDAAATPKSAPSVALPPELAPRSFKPQSFAPSLLTHPHAPSRRPPGSSLPTLTPFRTPELLQHLPFSPLKTTIGTPVNAR